MLDALWMQRAAHYLHARGVPVVPRILKRAILHLYGSVLDPETEFGEGTVLGYGGLNIVVHPEARFGRRVLISQGVTIGGRAGKPGLPVIEDDVKIGAGAKILGPVRIGRGALIGANAVVVQDVRPYAVAVGIPAREVRARTVAEQAPDDPEVASVTNEFRH